ncbi:septal ring lytic transglycosylase RlpA family protein [Variovorax ginsengisoli]|uniref:Endolytic peptidoglycan transglycosylase RlpA n=1 Tax=Variovorax ginsengisoli TaxID=363844 RepID=A0ABT9S2Y2_9BURK|nr:septal ring lytic transglycosylase RlpA family protein [Variovorax ginsengisoli]MDP9898279.1 rare lipoprotein A [Variovorax ginsengisoli]
MSLRRWHRHVLTVCAAGLLVACATPPAEPVAADAAPVSSKLPSSSPVIPNGKLQPLERKLQVPAGVGPRSQVAAVDYDLSVSRAMDLPPDDGLPGDAAPRMELERGGASWYGIQFHQRRTASGERFDMGAFTAAHRTLPFGSHVCVRSLVTGLEVMVRINDRGPYSSGRVIDLSRAAADAIGMLGLGIKPVSLSLVDKGGRCGDQVNDESDALMAEDDSAVSPAPAARKPRARATARIASKRHR